MQSKILEFEITILKSEILGRSERTAHESSGQTEEEIMAPVTEMRDTKILMELEALAEKLGIQVIQERLHKTRSGICRLRDQYMLFIESNLKEKEKIQVMAGALARFPLNNTQMLPGIRKLVEYYRHSEESTDWREEEYAA